MMKKRKIYDMKRILILLLTVILLLPAAPITTDARNFTEVETTLGVVPFNGSLIPSSAFTQFDVELYWSGVPVGLTGANFRVGSYTLSVDFALANGTVVNAGDYFEIDMTVSGANFTTPPGTIVLGGGDLSVEIVHTPPSQNITLKIIFNNDMAAHTNITGRANINISINISEPGPVEWTVVGGVGSPGGGGPWTGIGTPPGSVNPGFNVPGGTANKGVIAFDRNEGLIEWQVGINNPALPAWDFFSGQGFTALPQYVRITDTLTGPHVLVPYQNQAVDSILVEADRILGGHVVLVAVDLERLWDLMNEIATNPVLEAEIRALPWIGGHMPADVSIYDPIPPNTNGWPRDSFMAHLENNFLRWNTQVISGSPAFVANYSDIIRTLNVPLNLTADGFYIDVPTAFFDNASVYMRYQTRVLPGADPGEVLANSIRISGYGDDSFTRAGHTVWDGWSGVGGDNTQIEILKQDPNNANANMTGAVFSVERQNGTFTATQGANAQGIVQIVTNANGIASTVLGLGAFGPSEVFIIREVTPPNGYILYNGEIHISIDPYNNHAITLLNGYAGAPFFLDASTGRIVLNNEPLLLYTDIEGEKTWVNPDNITLPEYIVVHVMSGSVIIDIAQVTPDSNGEWHFVFENLPKYDTNGNEIVYDVVETPIDGWIASYCDCCGFNIVNTAIPPYTPSVFVQNIYVGKNIVGDTPPTNSEFQFVLTGLDGAPMPLDASGNTTTITIKGEGIGEFSDITFRTPGTFVYTVHELNTEQEGFTYDTAIWTVTFVVAINNENELYMQSAAYAKNDIIADEAIATFTNKFETEYTSSDIPKTSDSNRMIIWLMLAIASASVLGMTIVVYKKSQRRFVYFGKSLNKIR